MTFLPDFDKKKLLSDMTPEDLKGLEKQLEGEVSSLKAKLTWLNEQLTTVREAIGGK